MSDVGGDFRRQLPSMIGMAGMFVATIFLAMFIRPWYDKAGLQAFGEAGASQLRYIGLELIMIFIFTAAILMLAKYKKEWKNDAWYKKFDANKNKGFNSGYNSMLKNRSEKSDYYYNYNS